MSAINSATAGLTTSQAIISGGSTLGGSVSAPDLEPQVPGVNAGLTGVPVIGVSGQPGAAAPATGAGAPGTPSTPPGTPSPVAGGGGTQASLGANALGSQPALLAALQAVATAIQQLTGLIQAQAGAAPTSSPTTPTSPVAGGGSAPPAPPSITGGGGTAEACAMAACAMHGSTGAPSDSATGAAAVQPPVPASTDANIGVAPGAAGGPPAPPSAAR